MREIVFKHLTAKDHKKRDLCVREIVSKDGVMATIERRCIYFIVEKFYIEDPNDIEEFKTLKSGGEAWKKRHFHILRRHDSTTGEDKLICKVAGTLYAVVSNSVYYIAFFHSFKIDLSAVSTDKKKV